MLLGRASSHVPQGPFKERTSYKFRLDFIQKLVNQFWQRWTRDLFPNLVIQPKWHVAKRNVEIGDVVMIQDSNTFRGNYRMGVVKETFPGLDGKVRTVKVGYKNNDAGPEYNGKQYTYIDRPVHKLIVIVPVDSASHDPTAEH